MKFCQLKPFVSCKCVINAVSPSLHLLDVWPLVFRIDKINV
jgi:hypothetical protein